MLLVWQMLFILVRKRALHLFFWRDKIRSSNIVKNERWRSHIDTDIRCFSVLLLSLFPINRTHQSLNFFTVMIYIFVALNISCINIVITRIIAYITIFITIIITIFMSTFVTIFISVDGRFH